ncbi:HEAT repeat domain-containing protein [Actinomadura fulvescens]|uniref:HEAT repeat domain-containing protein n=1 Tax=Actinomadura fulvescens TaxID=46160 RepID=A0ABN3PLE0_9ACTN
MGARDARRLYDELRSLFARAKQVAGERASQREIERALRRDGVRLSGQRISEWIPDDPARARVPRDAEKVWALVRVLSDLAGAGRPDERYWRDLVERAQPVREAGGGGPSPMLARYLVAAKRAAHAHPYPGVIPGTVPPLADIYLRQYVDQGQDDQAVLGLDLLTSCGTCVILGGPGGGKSSLLRRYLATSAELWPSTAGAVPLIVPAADLVDRRPLPTLLAASANRALSDSGLLEELPPAFFAAEPHPGVPWTVMVDGLDEIAASEARRRLLQALRSAAEQGSAHRFVVTTRPLSLGELRAFGAEVPHFVLQPFAAEDLGVLAGRWFAALGVPDPERATAGFLAALARLGIADLARTPLMASMLCQLHAHDPDRPLPVGRGQIYRRFLDLLYERLHAEGLSGVRPQTRVALERWPSKALNKAEHVLNRLPEMIAELAAERWAGNQMPAVDFLAGLPGAECPGIPEQEWRQYLRALLVRSGLLAERSGGLAFLHHTILEYGAALHSTRDRKTRRTTIGHIAKAWPGNWDPVDVEAGPHSFTGFVLDGAGEQANGLLRRLATGEGLEGCQFIAHQVRLGTLIPAQILDAAADTLAGAVGKPDPESHPAEAIWELGRLGGPRAVQHLFDLGRSSSLDAALRTEAARELVRLDDPRAPGLLIDIVHAVSSAAGLAARAPRWVTRDYPGAEAIRVLGRLGDGPDIERLTVLARDPAVDGLLRVEAAREMIRLTEEDGATSLLAAFVRDRALDRSARIGAIDALARQGDLLGELAVDAGLAGFVRLEAARRMAMSHHPAGQPSLARLARDSDLDDSLRWEATAVLALYDIQKAQEVLAEWVRDATIDDRLRGRAARRLARLGDARAVEPLIALIRRGELEGHQRVSGIRELAAFMRNGHTLTSIHLTLDGLAGDPALEGHLRLEAARQLGRFAESPAADRLFEIAVDGTLGTHVRHDAAQELAKTGDRRAEDLYALLPPFSAGSQDDPSFRVALARAHLRVGRGAELAAFARDEGLEPFLRIEAADGLARSGNPDGTDLLAELMVNDTFDRRLRGRAARRLARLGDTRSIPALSDLAGDATLDGTQRVKATRELLRLGAPVAADLLVRIATDPAVQGFQRIWAVRHLAGLGDPRTAAALRAVSGDAALGGYFREEAARRLHELNAVSR